MEKLFKHVVMRFPEWREDIVLLLRDDEDFKEMCLDYEEVVYFLERGHNDPKAAGQTITEHRRLMEDLEAEILECLQEREASPEPQSPPAGEGNDPRSNNEG